MKRRLTFIVAVTTLLAGCSKEAAYWTQQTEEEAFGTLKISVVDAATRAGHDDHEVAGEKDIKLEDMYPEWNGTDWDGTLAVVLSCDTANDLGAEHYKSYPRISNFNDAKTPLYAKDGYKYSVKVVSKKSPENTMFDYTDPEADPEDNTVTWQEAIFSSESEKKKLVINAPEGPDIGRVYFEGVATGISIKPSTAENPDPTTATVTVKIANSAVIFDFTDNFKKYFAAADLTLKTADGFEQEISYTAGTSTYYWINPRPFKLEGTVTRQSPGTGLAGATEEITITPDEVLPGHCYTYTIDISTVGNIGDGTNDGITITCNDAIVKGQEFDYDLSESTEE